MFTLVQPMLRIQKISWNKFGNSLVNFFTKYFFFGLNNLELEEPDEEGFNNPAYEPSTLLDITRGNSEDLLIK